MVKTSNTMGSISKTISVFDKNDNVIAEKYIIYDNIHGKRTINLSSNTRFYYDDKNRLIKKLATAFDFESNTALKPITYENIYDDENNTVTKYKNGFVFQIDKITIDGFTQTTVSTFYDKYESELVERSVVDLLNDRILELSSNDRSCDYSYIESTHKDVSLMINTDGDILHSTSMRIGKIQ